jgi:hypothetical protein
VGFLTFCELLVLSFVLNSLLGSMSGAHHCLSYKHGNHCLEALTIGLVGVLGIIFCPWQFFRAFVMSLHCMITLVLVWGVGVAPVLRC